MRSRGVTHPFSFLLGKDFTRQEASSLLSAGLRRISLSMIFRLCDKFKCMPNDLFSYDGPADHPLSVLNKPLEKPLVEQTKDLTQEELEVLQRMMAKCIEEIVKGRGK